MPDRVSDLEARVSSLSEQVASLTRRLAALEAGSSGAARDRAAGWGAPSAAVETVVDEPQVAAEPGAGLLAAALPLGGRALLVLAGAFLLRALTEAGVMPGGLGATLGLLYGVTWILLADRAARAGASPSAIAHGATALVVSLPLLYETVTRFRLLTAPVALLGTALVVSALLLVASRRRLEALAWLAVAGGLVTVFALLVEADRWAPGTLVLLVLGIECLWLGYLHGWRWLRWPVSILADLCVLGLAIRAVSPYAEEGPRLAMLVGAALLALFLVSFAARTILFHRGMHAFEVFQTVAAIGASLGGAAIIASHTTTSAVAFGVVAAACGATAYAVAFALRGQQAQDRADFPFYGAVAVLLVTSGTLLALGRTAMAVIWCGLSIGSAALTGRFRRRSLAVHAAVYAWGGAIAAGLVTLSTRSLLESLAEAREPSSGVAVLGFAAAVAGVGLLGRAGPGAGERWVARLPLLALLALGALGATGLTAAVLMRLLVEVPGGPSPGTAAAVRTAALVAVALLLASTGRLARWREAGWLASAALVVTGIKIVAEDLPAGRPATLVVTFALYGAALLLVPRLLRRRPAGLA